MRTQWLFSVCLAVVSRPDAPEQPVMSEVHKPTTSCTVSYQPQPHDGGTTYDTIK